MSKEKKKDPGEVLLVARIDGIAREYKAGLPASTPLMDLLDGVKAEEKKQPKRRRPDFHRLRVLEGGKREEE